MAHRVIEIPFGSTILEDNPVVEVVRKPGEMVNLIVKYDSCYSGEGNRMGELTFVKVFQYRWTYGEIDYDDFESDPSDYAFGLIEITDSRHIADILAKTEKQRAKDSGLVLYMKLYNVRHFRLGFDEYGYFDILAADVCVREIENPIQPDALQ